MIRFVRTSLSCLIGLALSAGFIGSQMIGAHEAADGARNGAPASAVFQIQHSLTVKDIPAGAKKVRIWFWFPDETPFQKVHEFSIPKAPAGYKVTRDPVHGHRYLYAEVSNPGDKVSIATEFVVERLATYTRLDPARAGELTDMHRRQFADQLRDDCPCMEINDELRALAKKICGGETNVVKQARKIFDWIVANSDHYSKGPKAPKSSGKGSAMYCLQKKGGGCTDQHALFIALARARGIPTRLHFGSRLVAANENKDFDPGYRCWVQYFVPNYGWVSADLSAADTTPGKEDYFFSGLDERRIWFHEGRDMDLTPRQDSGKVNLLIIAHVEVDGKLHTAFDRKVRFHTVKTTK